MGKKSRLKKLKREMSEKISEKEGKKVNLSKIMKNMERNKNNYFDYYTMDKNGNPAPILFNPLKAALKGKPYKCDGGKEVMKSAQKKFEKIVNSVEESRNGSEM